MLIINLPTVSVKCTYVLKSSSVITKRVHIYIFHYVVHRHFFLCWKYSIDTIPTKFYIGLFEHFLGNLYYYYWFKCLSNVIHQTQSQ